MPIPATSWLPWVPTFAGIPTNPGRVRRAICCGTGCSRPTMARRNEATGRASRCQPRGMPAQVIFHEGGNEIVAVVVTGLETKGQGDLGLRAGAFQQFRAKLLGQEAVGIAAVHQEIEKSG